MRKLILSYTIAMLVLACYTPIKPSEKQLEFAKLIQNQTGILKAEWGTTLVFDVTVDIDYLGTNPKLEAEQLADQIASAGLNFTEESICVIIYVGHANKLASTCLNK